jgi:cardiolipin synthase
MPDKPRVIRVLFRCFVSDRLQKEVTVIDGKIGYVGGFNIAEEYLGKKAKFGNWEDLKPPT